MRLKPEALSLALVAFFAALLTLPIARAQDTSAAAENGPAATAEQISGWIAQLDANEYLVREQATRDLLGAGEAALEALLAAANGDRPEPADRAVWILLRLGQSEDNELAIAALERLVELRDRPRLVEKAEAHLAERAVVACEAHLAPLGAELAVKFEPVDVGNMVPMLEVILGPEWQGSIDDLRGVARLRHQLHFRLEGKFIDDGAVKLFAERDKLSHLQLRDTNVTPAAVDAIKKDHPDATIYMRNDALLGVAAQNHPQGAMVQHVERESAAATAGILPGDVITSLDGQPLPDFDRLTVRIAQHRPGDTIDVEVLRGDETKKLSATLGSWSR